jgi:hypothetical protein
VLPIIKISAVPVSKETAKEIPINYLEKSEYLINVHSFNKDTLLQIIDYMKLNFQSFQKHIKIRISLVLFKHHTPLDNSKEYIEGAKIEGIKDRLLEYPIYYNKNIDTIIAKFKALIKLQNNPFSKSKIRAATLDEALKGYTPAQRNFIEIIDANNT